MRKQSWFVVSAMLAAVAPWACSQTPGVPTTSSGTGGSMAQHSASSGAGGLDCTGILSMGSCDDCLQASCCQSYADCADDSNCFNCVFGGSTDPTCADPAIAALS